MDIWEWAMCSKNIICPRNIYISSNDKLVRQNFGDKLVPFCQQPTTKVKMTNKSSNAK